jgi:hypothetical protein
MKPPRERETPIPVPVAPFAPGTRYSKCTLARQQKQARPACDSRHWEIT